MLVLKRNYSVCIVINTSTPCKDAKEGIDHCAGADSFKTCACVCSLDSQRSGDSDQHAKLADQIKNRQFNDDISLECRNAAEVTIDGSNQTILMV